MSKQRPSRPDARLWQARVFHNTYTRRGRRREVRGWSVKIQYQGRRRTFSLAGRTRSAAAVEARKLSSRLHSYGWTALVGTLSRGLGPPRTPSGVEYWKQRLLLRPAPGSGADPSQRCLVVRIDHSGRRCYFPLAGADPEAAARRAELIHRTVVEQGWVIAAGMFPREICVAFHWSYAPLFWSYATLHTEPGGQRPAEINPVADRLRILLVEPDTEVRLALARSLDQQPGCRCVACDEAQAAAYLNSEHSLSLCLLNAHHREVPGLVAPPELGALPGGLPALTYSVHADSDEVFLAPPGGITGYLLARLPPTLMLAPVLGGLEAGGRSPEVLGRAVQLYAQRLLQPPPAGVASSPVAVFTHREQQVLNLLSKGQVDKEIADALGISAWTVHDHLKRIFEKLGVHSRLEAVLAYLQK